MAKEEFLGFTFNGHHSSEFGITRIINGDRMKEDLFPESADITQNIEGADGTLYYGSNYKKRDFVVDFAFDNMTEKTKKAMQKWLSIKEPAELEFDEKEDIKYSAKITGKTTLSYIPFDDGNNGTIYKGEGAIVFTCYNPFGRKQKTIGPFQKNGASICEIRMSNEGDLNAYPVFSVNSEQFHEGVLSIQKKIGNGSTLLMKITKPTTATDKVINIDCKKFLIYDSSGTVCNDWITEGDFFSIEPSVNTVLYLSLSSNNNTLVKYEELYY